MTKGSFSVVCLTRVVTALAVLVHATLGCCTHGAHAAAGAAFEHAECGHAVHHHADTVDQHGARPMALEVSCLDDQHPVPTVPYRCCRTTCKWPARELRDHEDLLTFDLAMERPSDINRALTQRLVGLLAGRSLFSDFLPHTHSVRSHLAHCVFLI